MKYSLIPVNILNNFLWGLSSSPRDYNAIILIIPPCIGWVCQGTEINEDSGCAIVLSNSEDGFNDIEIGIKHKGHKAEVIINDEGWRQFPVPAGSITVWIE